MRKRGGYIISLDHAANQAVTYAGFRYYCDRLERLYGKANTVTKS
jgi:hypothetical protein